MLYQEYKKKMLKFVRFLDKIWRHKVLILSMITMVIAIFIAFLATKGLVFGQSMGKTEYIYGEKIEFSANALFSEIECEYKRAEDGASWSKDTPYLPGEYKIRAVANGSFGSQKHGKEFSFKIVQREINVSLNEQTICYGDLPTVSADNLAYNDVISCNSYTYGDLSESQTTVTPTNIVIMSENGQNVTSAYIINVPSEFDISFTKRPIAITTNSAQKEYDGTPLSENSYSITSGSLAFMDELLVSMFPSQTTAGSVANIPEYRVVISNPDGKNVTGNYDITVIDGSLEVTKRPVTIYTHSAEFTFADVDFTEDGYTIDDATPLIDGHTIVVQGATPIRYVGECSNELVIQILNEAGDDVTSSYEITYNCGTLKVEQREITIETASGEWVYDAYNHSNTSYTLYDPSDLVSGHTVTPFEVTEIKNVGTVDNETTFKIYSSQTDVTENYYIRYVCGNLTVNHREILLRSSDQSKVYDATPLYGSSYDVLSELGVADGQIIVPTYTASLTDVGDTTSTFSVEVYEGEEKVSDNYIISYEYGTLEVTKRPIRIKGQYAEKIYDGTPLENKAYTLLSDSLYDVVSTQTVEYTSYASRTVVGSTPNEIAIEIYEDGVRKTDNYDIYYGTPDMLVIIERYITVTAASNQFYYDGTYKSDNRYTIGGEGLAPNQTAEVTISGYVKIVDTVQNRITSVIIRDQNGENVTENYEIDEYDGTLEVLKRPITLVSESYNKIYDGYELFGGGVSVSDSEGMGLAPNQSIEFSDPVSIIDHYQSGTENYFTAVITDPVDGNVTRYYEITEKFGTLSIDRRPITLSSASTSKTYDGQYLTREEASISSEAGMGLAVVNSVSETIEYYFTGTIIDWGTAGNTFTAEMYSPTRGVDTTDNYEITYSYGNLTVNRRKISFETSSMSKIYDGTPLEYHVARLKSGSFAPNYYIEDYAEFTFHNSVTDVSEGMVKNSFSAEIYSEERGRYTTGNYIIECIDAGAYLYIEPRPITVESLSDSKIYDGTPLVRHELVVSATEGMGLAPNYTVPDEITGLFTGEITYFGQTDNLFTVAMFSTERNKNTTSNYEITYVYGTLNIDKRTVTIIACDAEKMYDGTPLYGTECEVGPLGLAVNDKVSSIEFVGSQTIPGSSTVSVTRGTVVFTKYDASGNVVRDVTDCYDITEYTNGTLTVTKREITITAGSASKVYDDTYLTSSEYILSENALVLDHVIKSILIEGSIRDVGTTPNVASSARIFSGDDEVTQYYNITYIDGTLEIIPREIVIITGSASKKYDGTPLTKDEYEVSTEKGNGLVSGHTITLDVTGYGVNAGEYENTFENVVIMSATRDVTGNYEITPEYGTLEIIPMKLKFNTGSASKVYDGTPLTCDEYELVSGELGEGHILVATPNGSQTLVGKSENTVGIYVYYVDEYGNEVDVSVNYKAILNIAGELEVTKRTIHITTGSATKPYDGMPLTCDDWTSDDWDNRPSILYDHTLDVNTTGSITKIGIVNNTCEYSVYNGNGDDVTDCFEVIVTEGTLEVTLVPLVFESIDASKIYDTEPYEYNYATMEKGCLIDGHYFSIEYNEYVDANEYENTYTVTIYDSNDNVVTGMYEIECLYGTLIIEKRKVTIEASDDYKKYDGTPLYAPNSIVEPNLELEELNLMFENPRFTWKVLSAEGSQTEPGESPSWIEVYEDDPTRGFKIYLDGRDVTRNFDVECIEGKLIVSDRLIVVKLWKLQKNYDGTELKFSSYMWYLDPESQLKSGHKVIVDLSVIGGITNAGTISSDEISEKLLENGIIIINEETGEDVTESYDVVVDSPPLTVSRRKIVLTAASAKKIYDGNPLTADSFDVSGDLPNGLLTDTGDWLDKDAVEVMGSATEAGFTSTNRIYEDSVHIYDKYGNEVTDNYFIVLVDGELEVLEEEK